MKNLLTSVPPLLLVLLVLPTNTTAKSVRWSAPLEAELNQPFTVSLVFEDCQPDENVIIPPVDGLTFTYTGQNRQINMIQGRITSQNAHIYTVRAQRADRYVLPSFPVKTTAGTLTVGELVLAVKQSSHSGSSSSVDNILADTALAQLNTNTSEAWVGQVIPIEYRLLVNPRKKVQLAGPLLWPGTGWLSESWSQSERGETYHAGTYWICLSQKTQIMTDVPGQRVLEPATQKLIVTTGQRNTWPFPQPINEEATVESPERIITIKPLPPSPDDTFTGAVGQFDMVSNLSPLSVTVGEPISWTIIITGTGNWPSNFRTPRREIPEGWRVIGPELVRENPPGKIFQASVKEEAVLVPDRSGTYNLPPVVFTYFDPKTGSYKSLVTQMLTVTVQPDATQPDKPIAQQLNAPPGSLPDQQKSPPLAVDPLIPIHKAEPALPRAPLPGAGRSAAPIAANLLITISIAPWALLPIGLALLGIYNATITDPAQIRIRARKEMLKILSDAKKSPTAAELTALICRWQKAAKLYWAITKSVPTSADVRQSELLSKETPETINKWLQLFAETDKFLYDAQSTLPKNWLQLAEEAAKNLRPAKRPPIQGLQIQHIFPKPSAALTPSATTIIIIALAIFSSHSLAIQSQTQPATTTNPSNKTEEHPIDPVAAYNAGDWQTAEKIWSQKTLSDPLDWHAHNNLALALMQQKILSEASAHLLCARLLAPRSSDVIWNGNIVAKQLPSFTPELSNWLDSPTGPLPAALFNAATWQRITISASWLAALAAFLLICRAHFPQQKKHLAVSVTVLLLFALPAGTTSLLALSQWGPLTNPAVVILRQKTLLRSLPTEADNQISREALPGETAVAQSRFLSWVKLLFPSGEVAWAPARTVVPVYQHLPEH